MAHQLGIVGSGAIARGLARAADEHHEVVVWARSEESAEKAAEKVGTARVVTDLGALADCAIVVEAVAEDTEVKCDIHRRLFYPVRAALHARGITVHVRGLDVEPEPHLAAETAVA